MYTELIKQCKVSTIHKMIKIKTFHSSGKECNIVNFNSGNSDILCCTFSHCRKVIPDGADDAHGKWEGRQKAGLKIRTYLISKSEWHKKYLKKYYAIKLYKTDQSPGMLLSSLSYRRCVNSNVPLHEG